MSRQPQPAAFRLELKGVVYLCVDCVGAFPLPPLLVETTFAMTWPCSFADGYNDKHP